MSLSLLISHRAVILPGWLHLILESYPSLVSISSQRQGEQPSSPAEGSGDRDTETLFDEIAGDMVEERLSRSLDALMSVRAIQGSAPSKAVGIIFLLKRAVREGLKDEPRDDRYYDELQEMESRVDRAALMAFDRYAKQQAKIYDERVQEANSRADNILARMYRVNGAPDEM